MTRLQSTTTAAQSLERMLHEGFAAGNPDIVDELCSPDMIEHQFGLSGVGRAAHREGQARHPDRPRRVLPTCSFTVADIAQNGDTVWIRAEVDRHAHRSVRRAPDRQARAFHGDRCRDRARRQDRRALGRARPVRDPGPDRAARSPDRLISAGSAPNPDSRWAR